MMVRLLTYGIGAALAGLILSSLSSCGSREPIIPTADPLPPELTVEIELVNDGSTVEFDQAFMDQEQNNVKLVLLKFYLANLELVEAGGDVVRLSDIELFDFKPVDESISTPQWTNNYTFEVPPGDYETLRFGVGVPADLNDEDPATFANEDALSIYSNMYWDWASMYRFVILEAVVDTMGGENFDHDLIFHTGLDELYRPANAFDIDLTIEDFERKTITITIDWNRLFYDTSEPIAIRTESTTHTTTSDELFKLARRFSDNFVKAISVE